MSGPTPTAGDNTTKLSTTAFVNTAIAGKADLASPTFTGSVTIPTVTTSDNSTLAASTAHVKANLANYATLASPTFTGTVVVPNQTAGNSTTAAANTAFVTTGLALKANLASPTFTGTPVAPTPSTGDNSTQIATTAFAQAINRPFLNVNYTLSSGSVTDLVILYNTVVADTNLAYNTTTGLFTAPISGYYNIYACLTFIASAMSTNYNLYLQVNGTTVNRNRIRVMLDLAGTYCIYSTYLTFLAAGATVNARGTSVGALTITTGTETSMQIFRLGS